MGRIIKSGSAGQDRKILEKGIVLAIRELAKQNSLDKNTYDLVAYCALSLNAIAGTIDESVAAWEKRGYWIKADHYRMEWNWTSRVGEELRQSILNDDWGKVATLIAQISQKLSKVEVSPKHHLGTPWINSWDHLKSPEHR